MHIDITHTLTLEGKKKINDHHNRDEEFTSRKSVQVNVERKKEEEEEGGT